MAVISSPEQLAQILSTIREIISQPSDFFGENNQEIKEVLIKMIPLFDVFEGIVKTLEKEGFSQDFWLFSTYLHVSKSLSRQIAAIYTDKITPVILLHSIKFSTILSPNFITKVLFSLKKQPKIRKIIEKFIVQKDLEFQKSLEFELGKIPDGTSPQVIQEYKNYFTNTRGTYEEYTIFSKNKQLEEERQRKLEIQTAKLKEEKIQNQLKQEETLFQERGGYDSIHIDQIQSVRKKALVPKKKTKKLSLPHGIEEKMEQKKLQEELRQKSEDNAHKFFQEKQKRQQDYVDKLKKLQRKGKNEQ